MLRPSQDLSKTILYSLSPVGRVTVVVRNLFSQEKKALYLFSILTISAAISIAVVFSSGVMFIGLLSLNHFLLINHLISCQAAISDLGYKT